MPEQPGPAAIIFDHDGTLIDSIPLVVTATNAVLTEHGLPPRKAARIVQNMRLPTAPRLATEANDPDNAELGAALAAAFNAAMRVIDPTPSAIYPGLAGFLAEAREAGCRLGVLSNSAGFVIRRQLAWHGLTPYFSLACGDDDVPAPKPDPAGLRAMLAFWGLAPAQALFIGDSSTDLAAAQAAGCPCVGVCWGAHSRAELAPLPFDHLIEDAAELSALLS